ncbi:hypothetical protein B1748_23970 [Paenibacillus sp. MY03]|jgi:mannose/fructose/N-acetylgalactosamine-specific phosphotransferase system component IIC|uniref:Uncharacterized protein n=1 Tax=Paenibacillus agaridevorans TaxID=171404 RepID=A0A2R5EY19_9BACL|nr:MULTISPECIES: hypothetical protein [Paenibacillus]OUS73065.1 hypothetical protein B1748_23970 [Paenibacillus sp. MY03]QNK56953.1 hypothetical protein H7F31_31350 [Paenibacillus sp. PAMC21692]GBG10559.1 hypothetical protein PAT3040_05306 [Paenibacillus agaridevorans]
MPRDWVTIALLAFGIAVGVVGVVAYLRMYRKEKLAESKSSEDASSTDSEADDERKQTKG